MPGEAANSGGSGGGPFAAPVLDHLQRLGCRGVHMLADDAPAVRGWVVAPIGRHGADVAGWRFGGGADGPAVLLEFADPEALDESGRAAVEDYLHAASRLGAGEPGARSAVLLDRDTVALQLHDLRNGLNSLLMNAAVMAMKLPPADRDGRFARQVQTDGERCAELLQTVAETLLPERRR